MNPSYQVPTANGQINSSYLFRGHSEGVVRRTCIVRAARSRRVPPVAGAWVVVVGAARENSPAVSAVGRCGGLSAA